MNEDTQIEMVENDDDVEVIDERQDLLSKGKKVVKTKSARITLCKALLITFAIVIFLAILIQIWSDYGDYLSTHSLPPSIHSMSKHCMEEQHESCMTKSYNSPECAFTTSNHSHFVTVTCETSKPNHHMVETNYDHLIFNMSWDEKLIIDFSNKLSHCLHLTIWSI